MSDKEIRELKEQVAVLSRKVDAACSAILDLSARVGIMESSSKSDPAPTRTSGYVNWNTSHDVLKTQKWVKLNTIKHFTGQMESLWNFGTGQENLELLPTSTHIFTVSEDSRFPQDGAYVNIYCPHVSTELAALKAQKLRPGTGLVKRFEDNCNTDVHTFSSFEENYQLRWV